MENEPTANESNEESASTSVTIPPTQLEIIFAKFRRLVREIVLIFSLCFSLFSIIYSMDLVQHGNTTLVAKN